MKPYALFQEYIWLLTLIRRYKRISLEEINQHWKETELSGGLEYNRNTFIRHKQGLQDVFGIIIESDRRDRYRYYIANPEVLTENTIQSWMITTLAIGNLLKDAVSIQDRILLESIPSAGDHLKTYITAMKSNLRVTITYKKYGSDSITSHTVDPYCLKIVNRRWYALVRHIERKVHYMLCFDRILKVEVTDQPFTMDKDFDAATWFYECYGIFNDPDAPLERVRIRAFGQEVFYLRDLPFHHSQTEVASGEDWTDFEYHLRISKDFYTPLLSRGPNIKVLEPQWLVDEIKGQIGRMGKLYQ